MISPSPPGCRAAGPHEARPRRAPRLPGHWPAAASRGQPRLTRPRGLVRPNDDRLTAALVTLARECSRPGCRRITALLRQAGGVVNNKRVERPGDAKGSRGRPSRPRRAARAPQPRLHLATWSRTGRTPDAHRTHTGRKVRLLNLVDEFTREALAIRVTCKPNAAEAAETLADPMPARAVPMPARGVPEHIRSNTGPEFAAQAVRTWIAAAGEDRPIGPPTSGHLHRAGQPPRDRPRRKLQLQAPGRAAQRRDPRQPAERGNRPRRLTQALQRHPPALRPQVDAPRARGPATAADLAFRSLGPACSDAVPLTLAPKLGAGQFPP